MFLKLYSLVLLIISALLLVSLTIPETFPATTYIVKYHVEAQVTKNTIPPQTVLLLDYTVRYSISLGDNTANICYNITWSEPSSKNGGVCSTINITELPKAFGIPRGVDLSFPAIRLGNMTVLYDYIYAGETTYNGVPVYVLKARAYTPFYCGITNKTSLIYVYKGLPIPLYASIYYVMCEKYHIQVEAQNIVLPSDTIGEQINTQHYNIIVGGLRGAHVIVNGDKDADWLKVANDGSRPAYIMVIHRNTGTLMLRILPPNSIVTIQLPVALSQAISMEAGARQSTDASFYVVLSVVIIATTVVTIIYLIPRKYLAQKVV